ncbi:unnamed protein product, partial [Rotaria sp. Silwood1]
MGSMYWHCLAGQTVYPVQIATKFKIPLIIWGAHQGVDQVGNLSSIANIIKKVGGESQIITDVNLLKTAKKIILPGVGAFDHAMKKLEEYGWIDNLNDAVLNRKIPVLGICLGMQMLCKSSEEGVLPGLGWIDAEVKKFSFPEGTDLKIPHMDLAAQFGNQSILVSIDVKKDWLGKVKLYSAATGKTISKPWTEFLQDAVKAGAGEIVLNAVDKDGTLQGMDLNLIQQASKSISVPLIAVGGAGSLQDIKAAIDAGASAVSAGAFFVFQGPHRAVLITYPKYKELEQLFSVSGGVDSSWAIVLAKELGLRPLAVHMDNGWNSELAQNNIENLVRGLGVDLYTHVIDWDEYRSLMQSFFDADVIDVELLYDNAMLAVIYQLAAKNKVKFILTGINKATEGIPLPPGWAWNKIIHLATLVAAGQMSREEALNGLAGIPYPSEQALEDDKIYFLKKMGWTREQLDAYLKRPEVQHDEKPDGDGMWINGGFFVLEPKIFDYLHGDVDNIQWEKGPLGHTGFKGSWMLYWLKMLGAEVKGYALTPEGEVNLFDAIKGSELSESIISDIRDKDKVEKEILEFKPDFIFHLAAQPLVRLSYDTPVETFDVNAIGTANVLNAVRFLDDPCVVILITTDKVYENNESHHRYNENDRLGGYDPYSASKACAEIIISSYRNSFFNTNDYAHHKKSVSSARAGNVIGGGDWAKDRIVPDIVRALQSKKEIFVRNPSAIRPWQHVLEPIGGYLHLGTKIVDDPVNYSQAWNFGPNIEDDLTVEELVNLSIKFWGFGEYHKPTLTNQPHEAGLLKLDITKAKE